MIHFRNLVNIFLLLDFYWICHKPLNALFLIPESVIFGPAVGKADRIAVGGHAGDIGVAAAGADTNKQVRQDWEVPCLETT